MSIQYDSLDLVMNDHCFVDFDALSGGGTHYRSVELSYIL